MRILVIDDNQANLDSAVRTLSGHDVTLCSNHDEANELLRYRDREAMAAKKEKYVLAGMELREASKFARKELYWDVVLCDLLMPAGSKAQGEKGRQFVGQEMPVGWSLALYAAKEGVRYVAVVTDTNHHDHPASAMVDGFGGHVFEIDGAKMMFENNPRYIPDGCYNKKDWGKILNKLMGIEEDEKGERY